MRLVYYFVVFAILGWMLEFIYRSACEKRLVNPGFLKGFYLPIYGLGGVWIVFGDSLLAAWGIPFRLLFYFATLTGIELLIGLTVERFLHLHLWDYRGRLLSIGGYVCLRYSLYWALMALALDLSLDWIAGPVQSLIEQTNPTVEIITGILILTMLVDFVVSTKMHIKGRHLYQSDHENLRQEFVRIVVPTLMQSDVLKLKDINHHFGKSRLDHTLDVAWMAFRITERLSLDTESTVKGALLHDLFYYDWLREGPRWHGFRHPAIALQNALRITSLSEKERDIIKKHMWPLTVIPPRYAESWVICFSDTLNSWRDYLVPLCSIAIGRRKAWSGETNGHFPAFSALQEGYLRGYDRPIGSAVSKESTECSPTQKPLEKRRTTDILNRHNTDSGVSVS